jgi:hypothetical protein
MMKGIVAGRSADGASRRSSSRSAARQGTRRDGASAGKSGGSRAAKPGARGASSAGGQSARRSSGARRRAGGPLRARWGRVAVLALILIAAGLYYTPLRDFFTQQDRYSKELASAQAFKADNKAIEEQIAAMHGKQWVVREARSQFQLVPEGMQAFVITGLPSDEEAPRPIAAPKQQTLTWGDRLRDLWDALLR